jgi:hypothetical protein
MQNKEIIDYISQELASHTSEADIRNALIGTGWQEADIDENMAAAKGHAIPAPIFDAAEPHSPQTAVQVHKPGISKKIKLIVGVVVSVLLIGSAAYGAYTYFVPPPAKVLQQARLKMTETKSFDYSGKITADVSSQTGLFSMETWLGKFGVNTDKRIAGSTAIQFGIDFTGSADLSDANNPKSNLNLNFNGSIFTFGIDMRLVNKIIYFKIDQIPKVAESLAKYAGVWIKVDPQELVKQYGIGINLQNGQPDLTDGQKKRLTDLASSAHLFSKIIQLPSDSIDGASMYHYGLTVDKAGLKNYLEQVNQTIASAGGFTSQTQQAFDNLEFNNIEVWIGKSDRMVHRISGIFYEQPTSNSMSSPSGSINFVLNFKNFNHPAAIETPADSKNVADVINDTLGDARIKARDARRSADIRQVMTALELYYNDHGKYPGRLTDMKTYLAVPTAPLPPDGGCTDGQNAYAYVQKKSGQDYTLTFCLGGTSGGMAPGLRTASASGIK